MDIACTIVSTNYIPFARVLAESFKRHHPDSLFYVLLVDNPPTEVDLSSEHYELLSITDLEISQLDTLLFKYDVMEASTAVKPFLLEQLLNAHEGAKAVYLDPDILVFKEMQEAFAMLNASDIILTPHILSPYSDSHIPSEIDFLRVGAYNLGFIAIKDSENVRGFLSWWKRRLLAECYASPAAGIFTDQKWIDLVPSFFDKVHILKHIGYNVAYWNLHERHVARRGRSYLVNDETDLIFYHFSGLDVRNPYALSKYQNRFDLWNRPDIEPLVKTYTLAVKAAGFDELSHVPYAFGFYSNSVRIGQFARRLYGALGQEADRFGSPFVVGGNRSFYNLLRRRALLEYRSAAKKSNSPGGRTSYRKRAIQELAVQTFFRILRRALGVQRYARLLPFLSKMSLDRNQTFLLSDWSTKALRGDWK